MLTHCGSFSWRIVDPACRRTLPVSTSGGVFRRWTWALMCRVLPVPLLSMLCVTPMSTAMQRLGIEGFLLFGCQCGIERSGRFASLGKRRRTFSLMCLHAVQTLRGRHLLELRAVGTLLRTAHGHLCRGGEAVPCALLRRVELELGFQRVELLGTAFLKALGGLAVMCLVLPMFRCGCMCGGRGDRRWRGLGRDSESGRSQQAGPQNALT
jgi:hypothetical protein